MFERIVTSVDIIWKDVMAEIHDGFTHKCRYKQMNGKKI
jgi:hypothetical protein